MTTKQAATPQELLRWLLGSAALGATSRLGLAAANQEFGKRDPLKADTDLYDPSIQVPIKMGPAQYQKYLELSGKAGSPAKQAMWDNSIAAATMVGGGALGWHLVNKLIERKRKNQLAQELQGARDELTGLTASAPPGQPKVAAVWNFLDEASERYLEGRGLKTAGARALLGQLKALAGEGRDLAVKHPAGALATAGTAGLLGLSALPGIKHMVNRAGSDVAGGVGDVAKTVVSPLARGAAAVLGPVATLSLLYGTSKGFDQLSAQNPRKLELAAMRKRIREEESRATPYFELQPELSDELGAKKSKRAPAAEAVGARYQDVDAARDAARG